MIRPRHRPRWSELRPFLFPEGERASRTERRMRRLVTVDDLRSAARRRAPRAVFDYVDGAAEGEVTAARSRAAFADVRFHPRMLTDVREVDTSRTVFGRRCGLPIALGPVGFTRLMHSDGELAVAPVADRWQIPYTLSTMGTTSIEELAPAPGAQRWFQLYLWRDRAASEKLVRRAEHAGYDALVLTIDTAMGGARHRDTRNGFTIPPTLRVRTLADIALHPRWWWDTVTTDPLDFASLRSSGGTVAELINRMFDPSVTYADLAWLRTIWPGTLLVKGVTSAAEARRVVDAGVDGLVISTHGGRQLDRLEAPLRVLPSVVAEVGSQTTVMIDGGIRSGADVAAAVALGADVCLLGRAYMYGLTAFGQPGVERVLDIVAGDLQRTMRLLGARSLDDLTPDLVSLS